MRTRLPALWVRLALWLLSVAVLGISIRSYYPFIADDALISLRYASRLLAGQGLTWTGGHPVEGYSNLLWILLVAALGSVGVDLVMAARVLGVAAVATALWILAMTAVRPSRPAADALPAAVGLLLLSLSAPVAVWAIGGLEPPLVGGLLAASVALMYSLVDGPETKAGRCLWWLSGVLALLVLTRPDGPLFTVAAAGALVLGASGPRRTRWGSMWRVSSVPTAAFLAQSLFRYVYYGSLVPNTALVKFAPTAVRRADGLRYLHSGLDALSPFSFLAIAALIGLVILPASRRRALYLALAASLWAAYVVVIGGDIFPAYRHFVPLIVIFAFAIVEFLRAVGELLGKHRWVASVAAVFLLIQLVPFARLQAEDKQSRRAVAERWEWQCRDLGVLLRRAFTERQPTVAVTAAGCLPYWSELPALDMLGLNDYYLPRHRPSDFGTGFLGHELGDGAYVLRAAPDMIVFTVGSDPAFRSGTQLAQSPEFHERYVPVPIRVPSLDPFPIVYFDRDSPRIGVRRVASSLVVPGFLFRSPHAVARLNEDGTLVVSVTRDEPVRAVLPSAVDPASQTAVVGPHPALVNVELEADARTVVLTTSASEPVDVESVTFTPPASGGTGAETATR